MAEVVKAVDFLLDAAHFFHQAATSADGKQESIKVSIQCLYTALSLVLAPSKEAEIRLFLGELLMEHTENASAALENLQKAYVQFQKTSCDLALRARCESSYVQGLIASGSVPSALQITHSAQKRFIELEDWNCWILFFIQELRCAGPKALTKLDSVLSRMEGNQKEFCTVMKRLLQSCDLQTDVEYDDQKEFEKGLLNSPFPLLKALSCLTLRLRTGNSDAFKALSSVCTKLLNDRSDASISFPGGILMDSHALSHLVRTLFMFCRLRFQLAEADCEDYLVGSSADGLDTAELDSICKFELGAVAGQIVEEEEGPMFSMIQNLVIRTCKGNAGEIVSPSLDTDFGRKMGLWNIQLLLGHDLPEAANCMRKLKNYADFIPTAYSHFLEAVIELKLGAAVHKVKESLLLALKTLNSASGKDDILKLCVMLLLASIYQETDFSLAQKMAATAYTYSCNLGNDRLALHAGCILAKMLELKGDVKGATQQVQSNQERKSRLRHAA